MALIFADVFPEILKVQDKADTLSRDLTYGRTSYFFEDIDGKASYQWITAKRDRYNQSESKIYQEYRNICLADINQSDKLSRHEKSIVKSFYKYVYDKFGTTLDKEANNMTEVTEIASRVEKVKNQVKMVKAIKKLNKIAPCYMEFFGIKFPLYSKPVNPFETHENNMDSAVTYVNRVKELFNNVSNARKARRLDDQVQDYIRTCRQSCDRTEEFIKGVLSPESKLGWGGRMNSLDYNMLNNDLNYIKDMTGMDLNPIWNYNNRGINSPTANSNYAMRFVVTSRIEEVFVFNGINPRPDAPMPTPAEYEKIEKISRLFGLVKIAENKVCTRANENAEYLIKNSYNEYNFTKIKNEIMGYLEPYAKYFTET